ncbi:MAG: hypothetical protein ISS45_11930 [Candidatus Omnitrophica bacterium]|nr:hypothetical protein [Candidatus Omnitrophota bacterium]
MLSNEEKKEMLEDGRSEMRRRHFRFAGGTNAAIESFDDYISFLNSIQKIFAPFKISRSTTPAKSNKL